MWSVRLHSSPFILVMIKSSISQSVKHMSERGCSLSVLIFSGLAICR